MDRYGDYPTLEEIKRDYNELIDIIGNVTTMEQALKLTDKFRIEINGLWIKDYIEDLNTNEDIEWIRYESYGCLYYIYVTFKHGIISDIHFDVWCNKHDVEFIDFITIDELDKETYDRCIDIIERFFDKQR